VKAQGFDDVRLTRTTGRINAIIATYDGDKTGSWTREQQQLWDEAVNLLNETAKVTLIPNYQPDDDTTEILAVVTMKDPEQRWIKKADDLAQRYTQPWEESSESGDDKLAT